MIKFVFSLTILLTGLTATAVADDAAPPEGMKLVYHHDFEDRKIDRCRCQQDRQ